VKEIDKEKVYQAEKCEKEKQLQDDVERYKAEANRYCLTADCVLATTDVLRRMNLTIEACDDFWQYSCGGWLDAHHDEQVGRETWGVEDEAQAKIRRYFHRLMGGPARCDDEHMTASCKLRLTYARCMDTETIDAVGAQPLQDVLDTFGGWSALGLYCVEHCKLQSFGIDRICRMSNAFYFAAVRNFFLLNL